MKQGKKTRQLPSRGGLNDLQLSRRTIADYAKASPLKAETKQMNILDIAKQAK